MTTPPQEFLEFSKRLGEDFSLVQGAGGNTSCKHGGVLYVKASGTRLSQAGQEDIFARLPVETPPLKETFPFDGALKPSIETSIHLLLPHKVVAHVHAVNAIAVSTLSNANDLLAEALEGVSWSLTPYRKPGLATAREICKALPRHSAQDPLVIILGNHGLVIGGDDCPQVERTLAEVESRLAACNRATKAREPDLRLVEAARPSGFTPAQRAEAHRIALDETALKIASGGTLYPDHVVFLGRGVSVWDDDAKPPDISRARLVVKPGIGAYLPDDAPYAAHEMAGALGLVALLISEPGKVHYLSHDDETALLDWDAEKHRQNLNRI